MRKPFRLLFTDLDGTLLNDEKQVSEKDREAIRRAREKGVLFGIASGRSPWALKQLLKDWQLDELVDVVAGFNGGEVINWKTGEEYGKDELPSRFFPDIVRSLEGYDAHPAIYDHTDCYVTDDSDISKDICERNRMQMHVVSPDELKNVHSAKVMVQFITPEELERYVRDHPYDNPAVRQVRTGKLLWEFIHPDTHKARGIALAAKKLGVEPDEIVAFGDEENDREMLETYYGVAVANATPAIKKIAADITFSNNDSGVGEWIHSHLLEDRPFVTLLMTVSKNGKITGDFLNKVPEVSELYYAMHRQLRRNGAGGFACGRKTMESSFTDGARPELPLRRVPVEDWLFDTDRPFYALSYDPSGKVGWPDKVIHDADPGYDLAWVIEILCERADPHYLAWLQEKRIPYLICGKEQIDIHESLRKVKRDFRIQHLLLEGGGILDEAFLKADCVDRVVLVVADIEADGKEQNLFAGTADWQKGFEKTGEIRRDNLQILSFQKI